MIKFSTPLCLLAAVALSMPSWASQWTVSNSAQAPAQFMGPTALQDAVNSASDGDTLLVTGSGTTYGNVVIDKPLVLIGMGYSPAAQSTIIGTMDIRSSGVFATGFSATQGLKLNAFNAPGQTLANVEIRRCMGPIDLRGSSTLGAGLFSDVTVGECIITGVNFANGFVENRFVFDTLLFTNNIFNARFAPNPNGGFINDYIGTNTIILDHNNFLGNGNNWGALWSQYQFSPGAGWPEAQMVVSNNIFRGTGPRGCPNCCFINNMSYGAGPEDNDTIVVIACDTVNYWGVDPGIPGGTFNMGNDYTLPFGSPAIGAASDGSDIGITGGFTPLTVSERPLGPKVYTLDVVEVAIPPDSAFHYNFLAHSNVTPILPLDKYEYIFDTDQGVGTGVSTSTFADTLDLLAEGVASGLALGTHLFGVRAKDEQGLWSHTKWLPINICETYSPVAAFTPIISGTSVSFQNNSLRGASYDWDFGDGTTSTLQYPVHAFAPGAYEARLITENPCYQDTAYASLYLPGLNQFSPHSGGNTGLVTLALHGFGFDENTSIRLVHPDFPDIMPMDDLIAVNSTTSAQVTFDLSGAEPGSWSVEVIFGNGDSVVGQHPFEIEAGDSDYDLTVALIGSPVLRGAGIYTLRITNNSNIDARFIPIEVSVDDTLGSINLLQPLITWGIDAELTQGGMWSFNASYDGGLTHWRTYPMFAHLVPANGTLDIPIRVALPLGNSQIEVRIGEPIDFNTSLFAALVEDLAIISSEANGMLQGDFLASLRSECLARGGGAAALTAITTGLSVAGVLMAAGVIAPLSGAGLLAFTAASVTFSARSYFKDYDYQVRSGNQANAGQSLWNAQVVVADATSGLINGQIAAYQLLDQAGEITSEMSKIGKGASGLFNASGAVNGALQLYNDVAPCAEDFGEDVFDLFNESESSTPINSVGSWDPNEKHGPIGLLGSPYHNGRSIIYTIYFENVDTATAPAQIIQVLDSLNTNLLDPKTAHLLAIGVADSLHAVPVDRMGNYFTELHYPFFNDLYTRINFTVDTMSGLLDCRLLSIDDATNEVITDPLGGFLPPNVIPPMGEGFIVISVDLKDDVGSGVTVENRAAIIFDTNEPIITNTHSHITDFDRPTSLADVLPDSLNSNTITVSWTSSDLTSSVAYHNLYYKEVGMAGWSTLAFQEAGTQTSFTGEWGNQYSFFTLATDLAGNKELLDTNNIRTTVLWPDQLVLNGLAQPITCADSSDATLSALGLGGEGPYTYLWSTGDTTASIDGLVAGTYSVTVTDALGAQVDTTFVLEEPQTLLLSLSLDSALTCIAGSTTQITSSATGGVEPYSYFWGGLNFGPTLSDAGLGLHTLRLTDANGCVRRDSVFLESPSDLTASVLSNPANACDGTIEVTPAGGVAPYTITWEDGSLVGYSLAGLCPGTYNAIVEDAAGCSHALSVVIDFSTDTEQSAVDRALHIFPNPTNGIIWLSGHTVESCKLVFEVRNAVGQMLMQKRIVRNSEQVLAVLDVSSLAQGAYIASIKCNEVHLSERIIKLDH